MSQQLPIRNFKWMTTDEPEELHSEYGYILQYRLLGSFS